MSLSVQWGYVEDASNYSHTVELSFTIAFTVKPYIIDVIMALKKSQALPFLCLACISYQYNGKVIL